MKEIVYFFLKENILDENFLFFCDERRIILDNSWVHEYVTNTLDYINF